MKRKAEYRLPERSKYSKSFILCDIDIIVSNDKGWSSPFISSIEFPLTLKKYEDYEKHKDMWYWRIWNESLSRKITHAMDSGFLEYFRIQFDEMDDRTIRVLYEKMSYHIRMYVVTPICNNIDWCMKNRLSITLTTLRDILCGSSRVTLDANSIKLYRHYIPIMKFIIESKRMKRCCKGVSHCLGCCCVKDIT